MEREEERRRPTKKQRLEVKDEVMSVSSKHGNKMTTSKRGFKRVASGYLQQEEEEKEGEKNEENGIMEHSSRSQEGGGCSFEASSSNTKNKRYRTERFAEGVDDFVDYAEGISNDIDEKNDGGIFYRGDYHGKDEYENSDSDDVSSTSYSDAIFEVFGWGKQEPIDTNALVTPFKNLLHKGESKTAESRSDHGSSASRKSVTTSNDLSRSSSKNVNAAAGLDMRVGCIRTKKNSSSNTKQPSYTTPTPTWLQDRSLTPKNKNSKNTSRGGRTRHSEEAVNTENKKYSKFQTLPSIYLKSPTTKIKSGSSIKRKRKRSSSSSSGNGVGSSRGSKGLLSATFLVSNLKRLKVGKLRGN
mmetsp:Transcript_7324/g.10066  ORF Transcript_7324/g.10066 Transcript_7324/m.10066 type:complete len:356 (-) Transcript_7324:338-1405(-)